MASKGFLVGLASEAAELRKAGIRSDHIRITGAQTAAARRGAAELVVLGCDPLISFGTAGALIDGLVPGDLLLPDMVVDGSGQSWSTTTSLRDDVSRRGMVGRSGRILALDHGVTDPAEKRRLGAETDAIAVDMESHLLIAAAEAAGRDILVVRVIVDTVDSAIPDFALKAIGADGRPRIGTIIAGLVKQPWTLPALLRLGRESRAAHKTLGRIAVVLAGRDAVP